MTVPVKLRAACIDLEANGLLDQSAIDYKAIPYKLKPTFKVHCAVLVDVDTAEVFRYVGLEGLKELVEKAMEYDILIAHNGVNYDFLVIYLALGVEYSIRDTEDGWDSFNGKPVKIMDTLVLSKTLNPDRKGHSVAYFGEILGLEKIDWRAKAVELGLIKANAPKGAEFEVYHPEMLEYCVRDGELNVKIYRYLMREWGTWNWRPAYTLELQVMEIITRQTHRGFDFDNEAAEANVRELDILMETARAIVEPLIPPKPPTQAQSNEFTPPKIQIKKDETISGVMVKWVEKHGGQWFDKTDDMPAYVKIFNETHRLPMPSKSYLKSVPAKISDTTHIKGWLVEMGWSPTSWKERDLSVDTKKQKLTAEKYEAAVDRYVAQTVDSPFCKFRCEKMGIPPYSNKEALAKAIKAKLMNTERKPGKVYTNPQITVGVEKDICPNLEELIETFPYTRELTDYLTYRHRRNSILGGGYDPDDLDDDDESDPSKGYMAFQREDGRIPTPADTCGAGTSRFKHRLVANIPRVSSLYGKQMRALFGASENCYQLGYDFDSLEAKIEAHYCIAEAIRRAGLGEKTKVAAAIEYAATLTAEKPNDVHTVTAYKITKMIGQTFTRGSAKNVKYGCSYGAQPARVAAIVGCDIQLAEQIFDAFWLAAKPLADLKEMITKWWKTVGEKKFIIGIDGRKIPTRSAHAIINSMFQSAGVICAKKAMVLHDRALKAEGLLVDFFKEDFSSKPYCQQMIAYHDEAQAEVSKELVKFKTFNTEEEAAEWKAQQKEVWSDIMKRKDGRFFVAYTRAGELAVQAVTEAGKIFKLEVELTAGYIIGTNWGNTH
jgi:hypothetical protein